jgi:hypothetical protein
MTKTEFKKQYKSLMQDVKEGYYGLTEALDEMWCDFNDIQETAEDRWKEIKHQRTLAKQLEKEMVDGVGWERMHELVLKMRRDV